MLRNPALGMRERDREEHPSLGLSQVSIARGASNRRVLLTMAGLLVLFVFQRSGAADPPAQNDDSAPRVSFEPNEVSLREPLVVIVTNAPSELIDAVTENKKLTLFFNDVPLRGLRTEARIVNSNLVRIKFQLELTEASRTNWIQLLRKHNFHVLDMPVTVGLDDGSWVFHTPKEEKLRFRVLPKIEFVVWIIFVALFLVCFIYLWGWTELLRDSGPAAPKRLHRPYSLARCQMAVWFALVIIAFIYLRLVTGGELDTITPTILALIGIGAGTALGAHAQDDNKRLRQLRENLELEAKANLKQEDLTRKEELEAWLTDTPKLEEERDTLEYALGDDPNRVNMEVDTLKAIRAKSQADNDRLTRLLDVQRYQHYQIGKPEEERKKQNARRAFLAKILEGRASQGIKEDVLTDDVGISFHRFQMAVWTIVLAIIFVADVIGLVAMPEFSPTLLGLMGISSGTYLGFMLAEPHSSEQSQPKPK